MLSKQKSRITFALNNLFGDFIGYVFFMFFYFYKFQALPKVPVPPLEETLSEYLRVLKPIVTVQQYEKTKCIVKQFSSTTGPNLHQYLTDRRDVEENWVRMY